MKACRFYRRTIREAFAKATGEGTASGDGPAPCADGIAGRHDGRRRWLGARYHRLPRT